MPTPAGALGSFQNRVTTALANYDGLIAAVAGRQRRIQMQRLVAEQCVLNVAVRWEAFIHDLIISYIENSPSTCITFHKNKVMQSVRDKHSGFAAWITVTVPTPPTRAQIEEMLDPKGKNVSVDSADTLAKKANDLLAAAQARKFSLNASDGAYLNFSIAMRNYLSHRSRSSKKTLNDAQTALIAADPATHMAGSLRSVAIYLNQTPPGSAASRARLLGQSLSALAAKLV
jgi:hypothetical protein